MPTFSQTLQAFHHILNRNPISMQFLLTLFKYHFVALKKGAYVENLHMFCIVPLRLALFLTVCVFGCRLRLQSFLTLCVWIQGSLAIIFNCLCVWMQDSLAVILTVCVVGCRIHCFNSSCVWMQDSLAVIFNCLSVWMQDSLTIILGVAGWNTWQWIKKWRGESAGERWDIGLSITLTLLFPSYPHLWLCKNLTSWYGQS